MKNKFTQLFPAYFEGFKPEVVDMVEEMKNKQNEKNG
jgi:hypothetical protein